MDVDEQLRAQSKALLQKLKARQGKLQNIVNYQPSPDETLTSYRRKYSEDETQLDTSTTVYKQIEAVTAKAREKLSKSQQLDNENKENMNETYTKTSLKQKSIPLKSKEGCESRDTESLETRLKKEVQNQERLSKSNKGKDKTKNFDINDKSSLDEKQKLFSSANTHEDSVREDWMPRNSKSVPSETPAAVRNRRIIDKNVHVGTDLNETDIADDRTRLNYSYSKFDESDLNFLKSRLRQSSDEDDTPEKVVDGGHRSEEDALGYTDRLHDAGNDRKVANFIRDTTSKPKSALLATGPKTLQKSLNKVSFLTSKDSTGLGRSMTNSQSYQQTHDHNLLGYDWIAALLDNDQSAVDRSEGYFEELKEFRRINREHCCNDYYMDSPDAISDFRQKDSSPVAKALEETRVKPYKVNERLFTTPVKKSLFAGSIQYDSDEEKEGKNRKEKEPTFEQPRFVRVSIPRSTLLSPHRVKPHRRNSFDDLDTYSLSKHCVKGYENSVPSMLPQASNVCLRDSTLGIKSKMQTTLADAEKAAACYPYPWTSSGSDFKQPATIRDESFYKSYMDMTLPTSMRSNIPGVGEESVKLKKATDDLLNSTYSLMYEMEKIRKDREYREPRRLGRVA